MVPPEILGWHHEGRGGTSTGLPTVGRRGSAPGGTCTGITAKAALTVGAGCAPDTKSACEAAAGSQALASQLPCALNTGLVFSGPAFSPEGVSPSSLVRARWKGSWVLRGETPSYMGQATHLPQDSVSYLSSGVMVTVPPRGAGTERWQQL